MVSAASPRNFCRPTLNLGRQGQGIRSLPDLLHFNAQHNKDHVFCLQASVDRERGSQDGHGPRDFVTRPVTMGQLHEAVLACAAWMKRELPPHGPETKPDARSVAVFMESDVGLFVALAAALYLGVPVILLSARLGAESVQHLMKETQCQVVLVSKRFQTTLAGKLPGAAKLAVVPAYDTFLSAHPPGLDTLDPEFRPPAPARFPLILHSSGTTGLPKPIRVGEQYPIVYATCHEFPEGMDVAWKNMSTLPLYHGFGLLAPMLSLSVGLTCCFPPATIIPAARSTADLIEACGAGSLMTVPSILEDVIADADALRRLQPLRFVAVGGGALRPETARTLVKHGVSLLNHYGATELGALAAIYCPGPGTHTDFRYLRLREDLGLELQPIPAKVAGQGPQRYKLVGVPVGSDVPFEIQDEMELNPDSPRREIRLLGRRDDMIVLQTGEKVQASRLENLLSADAGIQTAVCLGQGAIEVLVLVEPAASWSKGPAEFLDYVWALVQKSNPSLDAHARISSPSSIILKTPDKTIPRSDKGSVMRREVHATFAEEIAAAYAVLDREAVTSVTLEPGRVAQGIRDMVLSVLGEDAGTAGFQDEDDFYEVGMDSLQTVRLARLVNASLRHAAAQDTTRAPPSVSPELIYRHPSITALSDLFSRFLGGEAAVDAPPDRATTIQALCREFAGTYGRPLEPSGLSTDEDNDHRVVLLTGSTGNLGAHVLGALVACPTVAQVVCLMRPGTGSDPVAVTAAARSRQQEALEAAGQRLDATAWAKVSFLASGRGAHYLDPARDEVRALRRRVTHMIHLAWPMDFNRGEESFRPHLEALQSLLALAREAGRARRSRGPVRVFFASSIAVVRHYGEPSAAATTVVPEASMGDPRVTTAMGYAGAKWICEKMVQQAAWQAREEDAAAPALEAVTVRIGQLSGPEASEGIWKTEEHIPALMRIAQRLGAFPKLDGAFSWIPVDRAARVLAEMALSPRRIPPPEAVLHLENPVRQPVADFAALARAELGLARPPVDYDAWVDEAAAAGALGSLEPFFRRDFRALGTGALVLDTRRARAFSRTLRGSSAVDHALLARYFARWRRLGFLAPALPGAAINGRR